MTHVVFDLETTSADPNEARIVQMAFCRLDGSMLLDVLVNPGCPIPPSSTKVHGITDEKVKYERTFAELAFDAQSAIDGSVLCGYNSRRYDVPVLDRHLREAGEPGIDLGTVREIDAHQAWIAMRPRTLVGALQEFCGEELGDAHDALADARATAKVIDAMARSICRLEHGMDDDCHAFGDLEGLSKPDWEIDRAGKFRKCPETGRAILNIGKHRGDYAANHPGFLRWMLEKEFTPETKAHIERWLSQ